MTSVEVFVDRAGAPLLVGKAHFTRQRGRLSTTFLYDAGYLAGDGTSIDPALPLVTGTQHQAGLVRAFARPRGGGEATPRHGHDRPRWCAAEGLRAPRRRCVGNRQVPTRQ